MDEFVEYGGEAPYNRVLGFGLVELLGRGVEQGSQGVRRGEREVDADGRVVLGGSGDEDVEGG